MFETYCVRARKRVSLPASAFSAERPYSQKEYVDPKGSPLDEIIFVQSPAMNDTPPRRFLLLARAFTLFVGY